MGWTPGGGCYNFIIKKKKKKARQWWRMPVIPALGRQRQENF
jgi:hypothetical protein